MIRKLVIFKDLISDTDFSNVFTIRIADIGENNIFSMDQIESEEKEEKYVIKVFKPTTNQSIIQNEIKQLQQMKQKPFIKDYFVIEQKKISMIISEFQKFGSLDKQQLKFAKTISENDQTIQNDYSSVQYISLKLLEMISILQSKYLIHRDFKLSNIMIDNDYELRLIDQGSMMKIDKIWEKIDEHNTINSLQFTPYESTFDSYVASNQDIYSFGVCVYYLIHKEQPYGGNELTYLEQLERFQQAHEDEIKFNTDLPNEFVEILRLCLSIKFNNRPTCNEIYKVISKLKLKHNNQIIEMVKDNDKELFEFVQSDDVIDIEDFDYRFPKECFIFN